MLVIDFEEDEKEYDKFTMTKEIYRIAKIFILTFIYTISTSLMKVLSVREKHPPALIHVRSMICSSFLLVATHFAFPGIPISPSSLYVDYFRGRTAFITTIILFLVQLCAGIVALTTIITVVPNIDLPTHIYEEMSKEISVFKQVILQIFMATSSTTISGVASFTWSGPNFIRGLYSGLIPTISSIMNLGIMSGGINTITPLAPAIIYNKYSGLWIYILGDVVGAYLGVHAISYFCS